ncbi:MAG TPA: hypothetical protein VF756_25335 [Thermoanaerobaculia bacterium]
MRSRTLQGITAALLTTSALWLAGSPAMARPSAAPAGLELRLLKQLWQWLGDFWEPDGLTSQREAVEEKSSAGTTSMTWTEPDRDRGAAIDPNGDN